MGIYTLFDRISPTVFRMASRFATPSPPRRWRNGVFAAAESPIATEFEVFIFLFHVILTHPDGRVFEKSGQVSINVGRVFDIMWVSILIKEAKYSQIVVRDSKQRSGVSNMHEKGADDLSAP